MPKANYEYFIKKAGKKFSVPFADYTEAVREAMIEVGIGRIMADLVAGAKTTAEAQAAVEKKLDSWAAGNVRAARGASDPITAEAVRLATIKVKAQLIKMAKKATGAEIRVLAEKLIAKDDAYRLQAEANIAALGGLDDDLDLDLSDLDVVDEESND